MQVVFVDIEKYSRRRTVNQISVVDALTDSLKHALTETSKHFLTYAQENTLNFDTDVIRLPTGDGAAMVFTFEGLHDVHLEFSKHFLKSVHDKNISNPCAKFDDDGWCNCHANFNVTTGIADGKGILYQDLNGNYNVAGNVINLAARAMGKCDSNQILFSEDAFSQMVELDADAQLVESFFKYEVEIKHGETINVFQYRNEALEYLNSLPPTKLEISRKSEELMSVMASAGFPVPNKSAIGKLDDKTLLENMDGMAELMQKLVGSPLGITQNPQKKAGE